MKVSSIFLLFLALPLASANVAVFGGCYNATRAFENPGPGEEPAFHCHMDSTHCVGDEKWMTPQEVTDAGYGPCGCSEEYEENVFIHTCYDTGGSRQVVCAYDENQCPVDWLDLGGRFNNDHNIHDACEDGALASGNATNSCGKRCTCNYNYSSRTDAVVAGSTTYGVCFQEAKSVSRCSVAQNSCESDETFLGPHEVAGRLAVECTCDTTMTGACFNSGTTLSHCAIAADSCTSSQTFVSPFQLMEDTDITCSLCKNTWDSPSPAVATDAPTDAPAADITAATTTEPSSKANCFSPIDWFMSVFAGAWLLASFIR